MNENIGEVKCPFCGSAARVRKNVKGKLYFSCADCGLIQGTGRTFLSWVADHARMYGPDGDPKDALATANAEPKEGDAKVPSAPAGQPAPERKPTRLAIEPDLL